MIDIFKNDAFSVVSLTAAIEKLPFVPGRLGQLGLFSVQGINTTTVAIEERDGQLSLIQTSERGAPPSTLGYPAKRKLRPFAVPHLARESTILADSFQNVRSFGSSDALQGVQAVVADRLATLRRSHEATLERMRASALTGSILDADGSVILNLFTEFEVAQQTESVATSTASETAGNVKQAALNIQRKIEAALGNEVATGYRAFCGAGFFDAIATDLGVLKAFNPLLPANAAILTGNVRALAFGGITWEEYRGGVGATPFIASDEAYVVPEGTGYFRTYFAPADFADTVNTFGLPLYARIAADPEFNRYVKIHTQSNPLVLVLRPDAVVKVVLAT